MKYADQYRQIKAQHPTALVVVRLGDYLEAYGDDALTMAATLDMGVIASRKMGDERLPMASVPFYQAEAAIAKLLAAGHRVALVEPVGDAPIEGVIPRQVVTLAAGEQAAISFDKPLPTMHVDQNDANADWTKRSRASELEIHAQLAKFKGAK